MTEQYLPILPELHFRVTSLPIAGKKGKKGKKAKPSEPGVVDLKLHTSPKATDVEDLLARMFDGHLLLFYHGYRSIVLPATNGKGSWKWDLMNQLQAMREAEVNTRPRTLKYCRVGFIPGEPITRTTGPVLIAS